jgi:uncharacterized caspase-like protein
MEKVQRKNDLAVIVAIEDYRFDIGRVKYAKRDAEAMKEVFLRDFGLRDEQIIMWVDEQATKTALEEELPYNIRQLTEDDILYFYYAGHGFCHNGINRLTVWDSHPFNLAETTVSISNILLEPIERSECKKSLMFIDTCSTFLAKQGIGRDILSDMNQKQFEEFIKSSPFKAIFMSCSPGEKSYSSNSLQHGIWTWHLVRALKGEIKDAITRDIYITSSSLRDYLRQAIPEYITRNTEIKARQTPWAQIAASNTFEIRKLSNPQKELVDVLFDIKLKHEEMFFRKSTDIPISRLRGFDKKRGHFEPTRIDYRTTTFIQTLLEEELNRELNDIYDKTKEIFGLRRKQIAKKEDLGGGTIDTEYFRFSIYAEQNPHKPNEALITRMLVIRGNYSNLPPGFDDIFPNSLDEIVIPLSGMIDFDSLVERFEDIEESIGGRVWENDSDGMIEYRTEQGLLLIVLVEEEELIIKPRGKEGCLNMLAQARQALLEISPSRVALLE